MPHVFDIVGAMTPKQPLRPREPTFAPQHAFVVQFSQPDPRDQLRGRVEHVVSGQAERFATEVELFRFIRGFLWEGDETP